MKRRLIHVGAAALLFLAGTLPAMAGERTTHAVTLIGTPNYGEDFTHFGYTNPGAPKGGAYRRGMVGTFDNVNDVAVKGRCAAGISFIYDTLMEPSKDEPSTAYGLLAETLTVADDNAWAVFHLRKGATFHDGHPVTSKDVCFSFAAITRESPFYKNYFKGIDRVEALGPHTVKFYFKQEERSRELPYVAGQLKVLPAHYWQHRDLSKSTLEPPLGSGPYRIASVEPGKRITYERVPGYWGRDLPVNKGRYNFDHMVFEYFKDRTVAFEAFKAGHYDLQGESAGKNWYRGYTGKNVDMGWIQKKEIPHSMPSGMRGIIMNTQVPPLNDRNVRRALTRAFDFDWINNKIYFGQLKRHTSYFSNSEFACSGLPRGKEMKALESIRSLVPPEIFTTSFALYKGDGSGMDRNRLREAAAILAESGYAYKDGAMRDTHGKPLKLEILMGSKATQKKFLPFRQNLKRLGIELTLHLVDSTHYTQKVRNREYMMIFSRFRQSLSPGNEQRGMWHSETAGVKGSRNLCGIADPAVDALVEKVIAAPDRKTLVARTRALDRLLLNGYYIIPDGYSDRFRIAYWDRFGRPETLPTHGLSIDAWWVAPEKDAAMPGCLVSKTHK
ncbi:extracellular solute-binding protein [Desulfoluna spongiiphila]|uniref:Microcin C transport system substrate-binding protein n=1 Tax=Desulfoluna spongiiphila TaxID=419481 RepID=A0A1G5H9H0_9BACT|nr:extracellular solute-binding protein [Desulfoluna spongiiphila]SCY60535.1 microcin C transport system substrate-binding protein [Desulfoluna spongiiphila]